LVPEDPEFPETGGFSPIEPIASAIIAQVVNPETVEEGIPPDFGCKGKGIGSGLKEGAEKFGGVPKALPVTSAAGSRVLRRAKLGITELSEVFVPPIAAWIGVSVPGIDEEEVLSAEAGIGALLAVLVTAVQGVERTSGGEHPDSGPEFRQCVEEGLKDEAFFILREPDKTIRGRGAIDRIEPSVFLRIVDTHGIAYVNRGEPKFHDEIIEIPEGLPEFAVFRTPVTVLAQRGDRALPAHVAVDSEIGRWVDAELVKNWEGFFNPPDDSRETPHLFMNLRDRRIDADPEVSKGCSRQGLGHPLHMGLERFSSFFQKDESVCSRSDVLDSGLTGVLYECDKGFGKKKRLSSCKRYDGDASF
jgi:hypothetical protein